MPDVLLRLLARLGARPLALAVLAGTLTVLLCLPALGHGWYGDDWFHRSLLTRTGMFAAVEPEHHPVWVLFRFLGPGGATAFLDANGLSPWWADADVRAAFLRPLSALTHMLDAALWPGSAPLQHAHSLLWTGLGVASMGAALRRMLGGALPAATVALAVLIYAVEDAHSTPAAWLANRNAMVALAFGGLAIQAHLRWVVDGRRACAPLAVGAAALALAAAEAGLGALGWILAWQLTCDPSPWPRRLARLAPHVALVVGWRLLYDHWGYGAENSGLYVDPGAGPGLFLGVLAQRWPVLVAGLWAPLPVDLWAVVPARLHTAVGLAAGAVVAGMGALAWPVLRAPGPVGDRARLLALGAGVCLVPPSATFPMDRVVGFAAAGSAALAALLWRHGPQRGPRQALALGLVLLHGPVSAGLLVARVWGLPLMGEVFGAGAEGAPTDAALADQTLVFANGTDFAAIYTPVQRAATGAAPVPRATVLLAPALGAHEVHRTDDHTLVYTAEEGFLARGMDQLFRAPHRPMAPGTVVERPGFTAEVRSCTPDGRPQTVAFRFDRVLEDPGLRWVAFTGLDPLAAPHLGPWQPPAVGQTVTLAPAAPLR